MDPRGKVALVTGGARRVGKALSLALARAGAHVCVNYYSSADEARTTVAQIEKLGVHGHAVVADVSNFEAVERLVSETERLFGGLDILVNSAATFERNHFLAISETEWDHVMGVNLKGPFMLMQAAAPLLAAGEGGVIVNLADLSAFQPWPSYAHHAVSKAGLVHLTKVAARALAPAIRVNCIAPGTVLPPDDYDGQGSDGTSDRRLVEPEGTPEDVERALLYLIESNFVTGETVIVDGGRLLL